MVVPYFIDMISLVTAISLTSVVYVLPAIFYWKLRTSSERHGKLRLNASALV